MAKNNNKGAAVPAGEKPDQKKGWWSAYWRTAFTPELGKRFKQLSFHLGHFAYLIATIYAAVRLIRPNHPVLNPANIGKFGFNDVISAAAENVTVSRQTMDQVLVFGAVLLGIAMIVMQFFFVVLIAGAEFMSNPANAQVASIFTTPYPQEDLAFIGLEMIFGTQMFQAGTLDTGFIAPLHAMLAFFSYAMLLIAILLLIYFVFVVVGESAMTGTPFGKRFNGFYAPIRLVMAFGLLIPVTGGLNVAQYVTLYAAKMGSGMATQAWIRFAEVFSSPENLVIFPSGPDISATVDSVFAAEYCAYAKSGGAYFTNRTVEPYITYTTNRGDALTMPLRGIPSRLETTGFRVHWSTTGTQDGICGSQNFQIKALNEKALHPAVYKKLMDYQYGMPGMIKTIQRKIESQGPVPNGRGRNLIQSLVHNDFATNKYDRENPNLQDIAYGHFGGGGAAVFMENLRVDTQIEFYNRTKTLIDQMEREDGISDQLIQKGWAGAGIWYSQLTFLNGATMDATWSYAPTDFADDLASGRFNVAGNLGRLANLGGDKAANAAIAGAEELERRSRQGCNQYDFLSVEEAECLAQKEAAKQKLRQQAGQDRNSMKFLFDSISNIQEFFDGLFGMLGSIVEATNDFYKQARDAAIRKFVNIFASSLYEVKGNYDTNPLAQLTWIGKNMIQKSLSFVEWLVAISLSTTIIGALPFVGAGLMGVISFVAGWVVPLMTLGITVGIGAGMILYFMIPLMPFIYFLFAVVGWLAEIFEAIVAMPLWALAHIRIDGDGLPGQGANNGYYLIFGIFTRPIFILFGLIAAYVTFAAGVFILHRTFDLVVFGLPWAEANGNGEIVEPYAQGGLVNSVGFTVMYVVIVYNLAQSSFKLIDQIPNQIMRWMGSPAQGFNDGRDPGISNMQQVAGIAGGFLGDRLGSSIGQNATQAAQQAYSEKKQEDMFGSGPRGKAKREAAEAVKADKDAAAASLQGQSFGSRREYEQALEKNRTLDDKGKPKKGR